MFVSLSYNIQMSLLGKRILVIGGNGFAGNHIAAKLVNQKASVAILSRKGPKYDYAENKQIDWLFGDILQPEKHVGAISSADIIIHSVGTLIDSSFTAGTSPGGVGTYEQVNKGSLVSLLNTLHSSKKIIYLSSSYVLPFGPRYLSTKYEAESILFESLHEGYSLRPGFIYDWNLRKASVFYKHFANLWRKIYPLALSLAPPSSNFERNLKSFEPNDPISLQDLTAAVVDVCSHGNSNKLITNSEIMAIATKSRSRPTSL